MKKVLYFHLISLSVFNLNTAEFDVRNMTNEPVTLSFGFAEYVPSYQVKNQTYQLKLGEGKKIKPITSSAGQSFTLDSISATTAKHGTGTYPISEDMRNKNLLIRLFIREMPSYTAAGYTVKPMPYFEVKELK